MAAAVGNLIRKLQHLSAAANNHEIVFHLKEIERGFQLLQPYLADAEWKRDVHESGHKTITHGQEISCDTDAKWNRDVHVSGHKMITHGQEISCDADAECKRDVPVPGRMTVTHGQEILQWVSRVAVLAAEVEDIIVTCDLHLLNMNIGYLGFSELLHHWPFTINYSLTAKIHVFLSRFPQSRTWGIFWHIILEQLMNYLWPPDNDFTLWWAGYETFVNSWPYRLLGMDFLQLWGQFSGSVIEEIDKLNMEASSMQLTKVEQASQSMPEQDSRKAIQMIIGKLGRAEELKQLRDWLLAAEEEDSPTPVVIAVNGEAGIGKTSIVEVVYESLQNHFDCHAWIFVPPNPRSLLQDVLRGLLKSISVAAPGNIDAMDEAKMKEKIHLFLTGKKFLLVLDDLPSQQELDFVKDILPSACRAKVLFTSRSEILGCTHVLDLPSLTPQDSFHLFRKRAFLGNQNNTFWPSIESEVKEILETCQGLPLAIATIGGILSTKQKDTKEWSKVCDMIKEVDFVSLSYADLHPVLKSCFLYACSLPSRYEISCKRLQRLWIAEGFVNQPDGMTVEKATNLQLDELIQRNMIQVARVGKDGEVETCRILRPMREFGVRRSEQDLVSSVLSLGGHAMPERIHRLFFQVDNRSSNNKTIDVDKLKLSELFSFLAFDESKNQIPFIIPVCNFKLLSVLELQQLPNDTLPDAVGTLVLLHYLGLRHTRLKVLPKSLNKLQRLQTLDVRDTFVRDLPPGLEVMKMLKHLLLAGSFSNKVVSIETNIEALNHLLTLAGVRLTTDIAEQLKHLSQLQKLSVGEVRRHHSKSLSESIDNMIYLGSLTIKCFPGEKIQILTTPLDNLEKLRVGGQVENLLGWVSKNHSLKYLYLWDCMLTQDPLSALKDLDNLVVLSLSNAYEEEQIQLDATGYLKLKKLSILHCKKLKQWTTIKEGALRNLQTLTIAYCPKLAVLPIGLEKLHSLTSLEIAEMPETFIGEAKQLHSSLPTFSLRVRDTSQLFLTTPAPKKFPMSMPVNQMRKVTNRELPPYQSKKEM